MLVKWGITKLIFREIFKNFLIHFLLSENAVHTLWSKKLLEFAVTVPLSWSHFSSLNLKMAHSVDLAIISRCSIFILPVIKFLHLWIHSFIFLFMCIFFMCTFLKTIQKYESSIDHGNIKLGQRDINAPQN